MTLKITNNTHETMTFDKTEIIGILDLRSLGYYKIKQDVLQQNLGNHYHFETADDVCNQFIIHKSFEKGGRKYQRKISLVR